MEVKKSQKADLENKRGLFLEIGLALTLALVFLAFEWRVDTSEATVLQAEQEIQAEEEIIPITRQEPVKPPPPAAHPRFTRRIFKNALKVNCFRPRRTKTTAAGQSQHYH
jgi:hypothetical protein